VPRSCRALADGAAPAGRLCNRAENSAHACCLATCPAPTLPYAGFRRHDAAAQRIPARWHLSAAAHASSRPKACACTLGHTAALHGREPPERTGRRACRSVAPRATPSRQAACVSCAAPPAAAPARHRQPHARSRGACASSACAAGQGLHGSLAGRPPARSAPRLLSVKRGAWRVQGACTGWDARALRPSAWRGQGMQPCALAPTGALTHGDTRSRACSKHGLLTAPRRALEKRCCRPRAARLQVARAQVQARRPRQALARGPRGQVVGAQGLLARAARRSRRPYHTGAQWAWPPYAHTVRRRHAPDAARNACAFKIAFGTACEAARAPDSRHKMKSLRKTASLEPV